MSTPARGSIWSAPSNSPATRAAAPPRLRAIEWCDARLRRWGARGIIFFISILWAIVLIADFGTAPQISFTLFYLAPVGVAAWYLGWRAGAAMALFGAVTWWLGDYYTNDVVTSAIRFWNMIVRAGVFLVMAYTLAMLRGVIEHERELARTDSLTGVPNWRHFNELAIRELSRARRYKRPITLAYIDIDNFKHVNDTEGHDAGNDLLRDIAGVLQGSLRLTDMVARVGGDEFVILLPDQEREGAETAVSKVRSALAELCAKRSDSIGFSMGVITAVDAPMEIEVMVQAADALMYEVKAAGKHGCRFGVLAPPSHNAAGPTTPAGGILDHG